MIKEQQMSKEELLEQLSLIRVDLYIKALEAKREHKKNQTQAWSDLYTKARSASLMHSCGTI